MLKCKFCFRVLINACEMVPGHILTLIQSSQDISEAMFSEDVIPYLQSLLLAILMSSHYYSVAWPCIVRLSFFNKFQMICFIFIMKSRALDAFPCLRPMNMSTPNCSGLSPSTPRCLLIHFLHQAHLCFNNLHPCQDYK